MADDDDESAIIIDNGSDTLKVGFSGDDYPHHIFPSTVGRPRYQSLLISRDQKEAYVGDAAQSKRDLLDISHPIKRGLVTNWDGMEQLWHHTFYNELATSPENHPVLLTEVPFNPKPDREKLTELMFEKFNVPAMHLALSALLALYSSGRTTGLVFETGHGASFFVPIHDHQVLFHAITQNHVTGEDVTEYLARSLQEKGNAFATPGQRDCVRVMKNQHCYVALDYEKEKKMTSPPRQYQMPDGRVISLRKERFRCPEALFDPSLIGKNGSAGVDANCKATIDNCDVSLRRDLYKNIVLTGGSSLFAQLPDRMAKEMSLVAPSTFTAKVIAAPERAYSAWIGGSIISSLNMFNGSWIDRREYDETGPPVVHRRCPQEQPAYVPHYLRH